MFALRIGGCGSPRGGCCIVAELEERIKWGSVMKNKERDAEEETRHPERSRRVTKARFSLRLRSD